METELDGGVDSEEEFEVVVDSGLVIIEL